MPSRHQGGRSYGQTRSYMDEITERHTRAMLAKAQKKRQVRAPDPAKVAEHKKILEGKGLLQLLEKGIPCPVRLPGNKDGIAIGLSEEGCVMVKGWDYPFHPKVISADEPPRT